MSLMFKTNMKVINSIATSRGSNASYESITFIMLFVMRQHVFVVPSGARQQQAVHNISIRHVCAYHLLKAHSCQ